MKDRFQQDRQELDALLGEEGKAEVYLQAQSKLVDDLIVSSFEKTGLGVDIKGFAIIALGGYGRSELYPQSDVDLMVLYHPQQKKNVQVVADGILYPLWDVGLDVGHGVRTVKESINHAREEYVFSVSLLDSRLICGDADLYVELMAKYRKKFIEGNRKNFVEEMKTRRQERRDRFGVHSYLLEPQIKEGRGGMRDVQSMFWTAKVIFGLLGLDGIESAGLLLPEERESFQESYDHLILLRLQLHRLSGRKNDQLYFEQQEEIAEAMGYVSVGGGLPVESFMRDLYSHLQSIALVADLFFEHLDESLGLVKTPVNVPDKLLEKGIEIRKGKISLIATPEQLKAKPYILVRVLLAMARSGLSLHYRTQKMIAQNLHLITDKVRKSPRMAKPIIAILLEAKHVAGVLEVMLETGLLPVCIPEFSKIDSLAQHDLYHVFTVDRHSVQAVHELRLAVDEWPIVFDQVGSPAVLYFATLLHDIGKGSGRDHSEEGAELVELVGERFGFSSSDVADLIFLVKYHLFIPENALRRDLSDGAFIQRCADTIGSVSRLAMLYLLSVADSRATGPSAWSEWKASLVYEMYLKVFTVLENMSATQGVGELLEQVSQGVDWMREQISESLLGAGLDFDLEILPADYLLSFGLEDMLSHVNLYLENYRLLRQKSFIRVYQNENGGEWQLLFMSKDRPGVLAKVCGVLALHNLAVAKAQIFTWEDGTVVDVVTVRPLDDIEFGDKDWDSLSVDFDLSFSHRLDLGRKLYQKWSNSYGRKVELGGNIEPRVVLDNESSDVYTVIEVYANDRLHLLYSVAQTLSDLGINIYRAYIATEVEQLIDVFYVLGSDGTKIESSSQQEKIVSKLLHCASK
ncbi:MAG: [protein-PII] uridylyltransferase [Desulfotalea sp.]